MKIKIDPYKIYLTKKGIGKASDGCWEFTFRLEFFKRAYDVRIHFNSSIVYTIEEIRNIVTNKIRGHYRVSHTFQLEDRNLYHDFPATQEELNKKCHEMNVLTFQPHQRNE